MSLDVTNGIGENNVTVTDALPAATIRIAPVSGTAGSFKSATTLHVWNTGTETLYAAVNAEVGDYVAGNGIPIPYDKETWFIGQPMRTLILRAASGAPTTAKWGAF